MHEANPLWGAPRIHGELLKLGVEVAESTVSKYLAAPSRPAPSQGWRTFLGNHLAEMIAIDFAVVPTVNGQLLFVFVGLSLVRRRVLHVNVTIHPTAAWTAQQVVEAVPWGTTDRYVRRDRDGIYGAAFRRGLVARGDLLERELTRQSGAYCLNDLPGFERVEMSADPVNPIAAVR